MVEHQPQSDLFRVAELNGDFEQKYGMVVGAFLYLRTVKAARGRSQFLAWSISLSFSAAFAWLVRYGIR